MGQITQALAAMRGKRVYLDTNVFIYFLEDHPLYFQVVAPVIQAINAKEMHGYTGQIAVAETMVGPYRSGDRRGIASAKGFFKTANFLDILPHDEDVFDLAAQLRARQRMKFIDAVHVATAMRARCKFFVTNDHAIRPYGKLHVLTVSELLS